MKKYLEETELLNYKCNAIQELIKEKKWDQLDEFNQILAIYNFVRDEIAFGYNVDDAISAEEVLREGYGQCNTKGTLFMALLRVVGIPCRLHGFTINKKVQYGVMKGIYYLLSPNEIIHTWVEVYYKEKWYNLEGIILDTMYLTKLQEKFNDCKGSFCSYGVGIDNFQSPPINWNKESTYIQKEAIQKDLGVYDNPDSFFKKHNQKIKGFKKLIFQKHVRHVMNKNVEQIRKNL